MVVSIMINSGEIHAWTALLSEEVDKLQAYWSFLSDAERARANKFMHQKNRDGFVIARGILRSLLAKYLNCAPQDLNFLSGEHGKLYLENSSLEFNISHSRDAVLYAFSLNNPVGIDVEFIRKDFAYADIAKRFFSSTEVAGLVSLPKNLQCLGFFYTWARKEAFIKAIGKGVFYDLNKFSVDVNPHSCGKLKLKIDDAKYAAQPWSLCSLVSPDKYAAALVVGGNDIKIEQFLYHIDF